MREIKVSSLQDTANLGEKLGKLLESGSLVTLCGDLGAGKQLLQNQLEKHWV